MIELYPTKHFKPFERDPRFPRDTVYVILATYVFGIPYTSLMSSVYHMSDSHTHLYRVERSNSFITFAQAESFIEFSSELN